MVDRARVAHVVVFSRLLFQVGSWPHIAGSSARKVHSAVVRVYWVVARADYESGMADVVPDNLLTQISHLRSEPRDWNRRDWIWITELLPKART